MTKRRREQPGAQQQPHGQPQQPGNEHAELFTWLNSYRKVSQCVGQYDVERLVEEGGGIAFIHDFLQPRIADAMLAFLESVPEAHWNDTSAAEDYEQVGLKL